MRPQLPEDDVTQFNSLRAGLRRVEQTDDTITGAGVLWRSGTAVPNGWLAADGSTFSAVAYPQLAALWASTTMPASPGISGFVVIIRAR